MEVALNDTTDTFQAVDAVETKVSLTIPRPSRWFYLLSWRECVRPCPVSAACVVRAPHGVLP